jgi:hypothetical protein
VTSDSLTLTFAPTGNSLAFINAIEVVSVPDELMANQPATLSPSAPFVGLSGYALETAYRINVGGKLVTPTNDTLGRTWVPDQSYLTSSGTAKSVSVLASSITYTATVTSEIAPTLSMPRQMRWQMQIQIAIGNLDLSTKTLSLPTPYYTDFVVNAPSGSRIKRNAAKAGAKFIV